MNLNAAIARRAFLCKCLSPSMGKRNSLVAPNAKVKK